MLATVGRCQLLIGMRLHALIYAANQQVPMIGISYDPKIDQFLARLDMSAAASTDDLQPNVIVEQANALLTGAAQWRIDKQQHLQTLMEEARFPAQAIAQYFAPTDGGEQDA
jgi:polysaccharide pyruvyl transferase WcaK-like protein